MSGGECVNVCVHILPVYLPVLFCHLRPPMGYLGASLVIRLLLTLAVPQRKDKESRADGSGWAGSTQEALSGVLLLSFSDEGPCLDGFPGSS